MKADPKTESVLATAKHCLACVRTAVRRPGVPEHLRLDKATAEMALSMADLWFEQGIAGLTTQVEKEEAPSEYVLLTFLVPPPEDSEDPEEPAPGERAGDFAD